MNEKSNGKKDGFLVELIKLAIKTAVVCGVAGGVYNLVASHQAKVQLNALSGWMNNLFEKI